MSFFNAVLCATMSMPYAKPLTMVALHSFSPSTSSTQSRLPCSVGVRVPTMLTMCSASRSAFPFTKSDHGRILGLFQAAWVFGIQVEERTQLVLADVLHLLLRSGDDLLVGDAGDELGTYAWHLLQRVLQLLVREDGLHPTAIRHQVAGVHGADALEHAQCDPMDEFLFSHGGKSLFLHLPGSAVKPAGCDMWNQMNGRAHEYSRVMLRLIVALFALSGTFSATAQTTLLKGVVRDSLSNEPLFGASVIHAPGKGVATDLSGAYSLPLPFGEYTITFSCVGYTAVTRRVVLSEANSWSLDVRMRPSTTQLEMVVVSAGRFEQRVGEVTQSLSVIRPDLLRNKNSVSLNEALDQVPGVVIIDEEPQIRAGSGFSYGAGSRVQVLVDDIPILSGDIGRPNWSFLPIENLEQVEVIKGASSVLYGSAALSGVINVRTAFPRETPSTKATVFSGFYDAPANARARWWGDNNPVFSGANFSHARRFGKFDLVLGGNAFADNGFIGPEPLPADTIAADPLRTGPGGYENRIRFNVGTRWRNGKVKGLSYGINANAMKSRSTSVFIWNDITDGLYRPKPGTVTRNPWHPVLRGPLRGLPIQERHTPHLAHAHAPAGVRQRQRPEQRQPHIACGVSGAATVQPLRRNGGHGRRSLARGQIRGLALPRQHRG
jgi:hypothetical protein